MIGKRKKRKKPTLALAPSQFRFDGLDILAANPAFAFSDLVNEFETFVSSIVDAIDHQIVTFADPIDYGDFETLEFDLYVAD